MIHRNAGAGIANIDAQLCGAAAATHHDTAARRVAHCVAHQIEQDAFKQDRIAAHPRAAWHDAQAQALFVRRFGERRFDTVEQSLHGKLGRICLQDAGLKLGHVEQRLEQLVHRRHGRVDARDQPFALRRLVFRLLKDNKDDRPSEQITHLHAAASAEQPSEAEEIGMRR